MRTAGRRWHSAAAALALCLAGCASGGTMVTEQQAAQFQKGVSTRAAVIGKLGAPNSTTLQNDGGRIDVYAHISSRADAASFIPVVGLAAAGATSDVTTATFTYDQAGVLRSVSTTASNSHVKTGLLNQN